MNEQKPFWLSPVDICLKIKKHIERRVQMINNPVFNDKFVFSQLNSELETVKAEGEYKSCLNNLIENNNKLFLNFNTYIIKNVFFSEVRNQGLINKYSQGLRDQNIIGMFFDYFEYFNIEVCYSVARLFKTLINNSEFLDYIIDHLENIFIPVIHGCFDPHIIENLPERSILCLSILSESVVFNNIMEYEKYKPILEFIITYDIVINFLKRINSENDSITLDIIETLKKIMVCPYFGEYFNPYGKIFLKDMNEEQKLKRKYYLQFNKLFNQLINSNQLVVKQNMLYILEEALFKKFNLPIMLKYISSEENLTLMIDLLVRSNNNLTYNIYNILKFFIANPKIPLHIKNAIALRSEEIINKFILIYPSIEDKQTVKEIKIIIRIIEEFLPNNKMSHFVITHSENQELFGIHTKEELDKIQEKNVVSFESFGCFEQAQYYYDDYLLKKRNG